VALSAETFTRLGQIIRRSAPAHHLLIGATSNGVLGYIGTREDAEAGGYASLGSARLYGMALPVAGAGEAWAGEAAQVVAQVLAP
jgi:hypothetical protein